MASRHGHCWLVWHKTSKKEVVTGRQGHMGPVFSISTGRIAEPKRNQHTMQDVSTAKQIVIAASQRILYLPHAIRQMSRPDRMITAAEVRDVVEHGEIIEDYPLDARGHSCLLLKFLSDTRPIHVVCAPKADYLAIITAYVPTSEEWEDNYRKRKLSL